MIGESLLLPGIGMEVPLFEQRVLLRYLTERSATSLAELTELEGKVRAWIVDLRNSGKSLTETNLEQGFNVRIMGDALGYAMHPEPNASLWVKPGSDATNLSTTPDAVLGNFQTPDAPTFLGVLELKTPGTNPDKPQARKNRLTPVEQAFETATRLIGVRWVLVSDMRTIRLYSVESQVSFITISLQECIIRNGRPSADLCMLRYLLHRDALLDGADQSAVSSLHATSSSRKQELEASFYEIYFKIRAELIGAVTSACAVARIHASRDDVLEAVQRLLDRMLFLAYCQDHPAHLLPAGTVRSVTNAARSLPGPNPHKVYDHLKALFREVDAGSSSASGLALSAYNGELFKFHPILDVIDLPDALNEKQFDSPNGERTVQGVWGFDKFNFWRELDEHLLGSIFEQSLSDVSVLKSGTTVTLHERLLQRRRHGIYYTDDILANYAIDGAVKSVLSDLPSVPSTGDPTPALEARIERLEQIRMVDPACGSGAFLVSAYRGLLGEWTRLRELITESLTSKGALQLDLEATLVASTQATLLRDALFGSDLLPQATEIAKLALWLRSARKGEKVADLGTNIVVCDSLRVDELLAKLESRPGSFDVVMGNPPWGAELSPDTYRHAISLLGVDPPSQLDSWEIFLLLGLYLLKPRGRLAFVLPDTLFAQEKEWIRQRIVTRTTLERIANLGMDWFGEEVRMGAVAFQTRNELPMSDAVFTGYALTGKMRRDATRGRVLLAQAESDRGKPVSQARALLRDKTAIWVTQGIRDDHIMDRIDANSTLLAALTEGTRGEELSGRGVVWRCLGCGFHCVPPDTRRDATTKTCPGCGATLDAAAVEEIVAILDRSTRVANTAPLVDTEDIHRRYTTVVPGKKIRLDLYGFQYKDPVRFTGPKLLVREAGVGLTVGLDESDARCVRTTYAYRLNDAASREGYAIEYILAALQSRTIHYYMVQITNQGDPRRPFANIRMGTVARVPIPTIDFRDKSQRSKHDEIVSLVRKMHAGAAGGGPEDLQLEALLRELWGLDGNDGVYIAKELSKLPQFGRLAQMQADTSASRERSRQRRRSANGAAGPLTDGTLR